LRVAQLEAAGDAQGGGAGKVIGLVAGKGAKGRHQTRVVRVLRDERQGGDGRLVLTMGVVDEDFVEVGEAVGEPRCRGVADQMEHTFFWPGAQPSATRSPGTPQSATGRE